MASVKKVIKKNKKKTYAKKTKAKTIKKRTTKTTKGRKLSKIKSKYKKSVRKSTVKRSKKDIKSKSPTKQKSRKRIQKTVKRVSRATSKLKKKVSRTSKVKKKTKKKVSRTSKVKKKTKKKVSRTSKVKKKPKLRLVKKIREFFEVKSERIPFYESFIGDPAGFEEPIEGAATAYMMASRANKKDPEVALPEVFERAFIGALRKGSFEPDDVMIYRYGILIRPRIGKLTEDLRQKISEHLKEIPGATVHHVFENETFAIRINIGSPVSAVLAGTVSDELMKKKSILSDVYNTFLDYFDQDVDWYAFWDTEEAMYA